MNRFSAFWADRREVFRATMLRLQVASEDGSTYRQARAAAKAEASLARKWTHGRDTA